MSTSIFTPEVFTQFRSQDTVKMQGMYPGVLVIQKGQTKGHYAVVEDGRVVNYNRSNPDHVELKKYPIFIEDETLRDVVQCGNAEEGAKCKLDHGTSVLDVIGEYVNFRLDGDKVRADLTLMDNSPHRKYAEELITKMSKKIGNSIDFDYEYEIKGDIAVARCVALNSVDIVDSPAATKSLFAANSKQIQPENHMPLSTEDLTQIRNAFKEEISSQLSSVKKDVDSQFAKINTRLEDAEKAAEEKEKEEEKEKLEEEEKEKEQLRSKELKTTLLSALKEVLPTVGVHNFASAAAPGGEGVADADKAYSEKLQLCKAAGMSDGQAVFHIQKKFPEVYNAKFGGSKATRGTL